MAPRRSPRALIVVAAVISMLLLAGWYHRDYTQDGSDAPPIGQDVELDFDNAHRLPSADAFRTQYFEQVLALPGLTISEAKRTCTWADFDKVNYMFEDSIDWNQEERSDEEIELHRSRWQDFVRNSLIPYTEIESRFNGRGIVLLAGNGDTLMRTKVVLRALKRLESTLPVEIHYYGDELDSEKQGQLTSIYPNTVFNDLAGEHNIMQVTFDAFQINYQLKTAAIINSRWAELFLLDSDNIPVIDPADLWESPTYNEYRTIFWPDIARTRPRNPAWAITNTLCRMDEFELESGQLLVDKARFWYHLQLAAHMNNDPDRYYDQFLLGDKDTFRFAWYALKTRFGRPKRWLTSIGAQNGDIYCGHSFAQHHPDDGRIAFLHGGLLKSMTPEVMRWNRDVQGGVFRQYKQAVSDEDPTRLVDVGIKWDGNEYVPDYSSEGKPQMCTDMYDTEVHDMEKILPGFEEIFREIGGYWPVDKLSE